MNKIETLPWDAADHIKTEKDVFTYLQAIAEENVPGLMEVALEDVARAQRMHGFEVSWAGVDGPIGEYVHKESGRTLNAYREQPNLVAEHANHEEDTARGGYAHRQLFELVQNGADALAGSDGGQIWVKLTPTHLYCADNGQAIDRDGVRALMFSRLSPKRGTDEIGRFGLGFKSVLGITDTPEFISRSGSFRFDRASAAELITEIVPDAERFPVLRLPKAFNPYAELATEPILTELRDWATNIVRLPLKSGVYQSLSRQVSEFPAEFLLFARHVAQLVLQTDDQEVARTIDLSSGDGLYFLRDGEDTTRWMATKLIHELSPEAKSDSRALDNADKVPIWWAAPIDRLNDPGKFWAFFPTLTTSLLAGILNAPWKTNEDRQNLLPGVYNDELIDAAAEMVADMLPSLQTSDDPARHLDALPRRYEFGDNDHINRLRDQLYSNLQNLKIVPDQTGELRKFSEVSYPPSGLPESVLQRWEEYDRRPTDWLHHRALTRNRLAVLDRVIPSRTVRRWDGSINVESGLRHTSIAQWLEALLQDAKSQQLLVAHRVDNLIRRSGEILTNESIAKAKAEWEQPIAEASMAAIQTSALIPKGIRQGENLGNIILATNGDWASPDPNVVRLSGGEDTGTSTLVHPQLEADPETLSALMELGLVQASSETALSDLASRLLQRWSQSDSTDDNWHEFWRLVRNTDQSRAVRIIHSNRFWRDSLRVRTLSRGWRSLFRALLPGPIVPGDGSRDRNSTIDVQYHADDLDVLKRLGAVDAPRAGYKLSNSRNSLSIVRSMKDSFSSHHRSQLNRSPRSDLLILNPDSASGPLDVMSDLSEQGRAAYTWKLLDLSSTYEPSEVFHDVGTCTCDPMRFQSPAITVLKEHGRLVTEQGIQPFSDALGDPPNNYATLRNLLSHPQAELIREVFHLPDDDVTLFEPIGVEDAIPLIDVWPGLAPYLPSQHADLRLIRCDRFIGIDGSAAELDCIVIDRWVYTTRCDDERQELQAILNEIGLLGAIWRIDEILSYQTPAQIRANRAAVRKCATDEERLLAAVGATELLRGLPQGLIDILEDTLGPLTGIDIAQAAIATFHTGALREYRHAIHHLNPPRQWAGRGPAIGFVQSLGFGEEWAGEPNTRRDPYIEVPGPLSLPPLHDYQRGVVENVRNLIRSNGVLGERRGMVSMPTGSGKTRVAVQSIVEAIREDGFEGGILWVADRDELCEQAVEAWREVWASEGKQATQLRISRMWAGQPRPLPTSEMHVIVASIQTLSSRIDRQPDSYEFLADFKLLVFDEAHRSVAPTFTSAMQELGLTRWRRPHEPLLIGLTATPYRGYDEAETQRLVNRYGSNRLDAGAFSSDDPEDVIQELQDMRILAQANHATIEGGQFSLNPDEQRLASNVPWLPESVERRIAGDAGRTKRIVQEYMSRIDPDWPTLIFATSVEHAQTLSALLNSKGVKSRAVSGSTDRSIRRRVVEEFRSGDIKVLVNYAVFREGFDAPKTRAIIVARPVYSPNLYFQMIGRGLRGVKNGGNDECLILNVRDNIENFERKLAFTELDWLWS